MSFRSASNPFTYHLLTGEFGMIRLTSPTKIDVNLVEEPPVVCALAFHLKTTLFGTIAWHRHDTVSL